MTALLYASGNGQLMPDAALERLPDDERNLLTAGVQAVQRIERLLGLQPGAEEPRSLLSLIAHRIGATLDTILHDRAFQALESTWRGLRYLVDQAEPDVRVRIKILSIGKQELARSLGPSANDWWLVAAYEGAFGGVDSCPMSCWVIDAAFEHSPPDVELLSRLAAMGSAFQAPVIAGASPTVLQMDSWLELHNPRDISKIFTTPEYVGWRQLRDAESSRNIALAMPRVLARQPWRHSALGSTNLLFDESTYGDHSKLVWTNAAYAVAVLLARSHRRHGWCSHLTHMEAGGLLADLPRFDFPDDAGGIDVAGPTEITISDRREAELARAGLLALVQRKHAPDAVIESDVSLNHPPEMDDPDATQDGATAARLSTQLVCARVVHTLRCLATDLLAGGATADETVAALQRWLADRVDDDPLRLTLADLGRRPLLAAELTISDEVGAVGQLAATLYLRPRLAQRALVSSLRFDLQIRLPAPISGPDLRNAIR